MNSIFGGPLAQSIGWALLHLVWQAAIVAAILAASLALLAKRTANARYAVSCAALALLPILAGITAWRAYDAPPLPVNTGEQVLHAQTMPLDVARAAAAHATRASLRSFGEVAKDALPTVVLLWLFGVTLLSIRLVVSWTRIKELSRAAQPAGAAWSRTLARIGDALALRRAVAILESAAVEVPTVVGWLKPMILLPASTMSGLAAEEIEMLLAHELAHIRRHDFFVNLLQTAIETLMFYHPAVWWISRRIRVEREHCCDDMAIEVCGNAIRYARALTHLEELRAHRAELVLAANGGSLLTRIRRLINTNDDAASDTSRWGAAAAVLAVVIALLAIPSMPALAKKSGDELPNKPPKKASSTIDVTATTPAVACSKDSKHESDIDEDVAEATDEIDREADSDTEADVEADSNIDVHVMTPRIAPEAMAHVIATVPAIAPMAVSRMVPRIVSEAVPAALASVMPMIDMETPEPPETPEAPHAAKRSHRVIGADGKLTVDDLISLKANGVTPEYITRIRAAGIGDLTLNDIVSLRAIGVTPEYVAELRSSGIPFNGARELTELRAMNVMPAYVRDMANAGYKNLTARQLVELKAMNVTPDYVRAMAAAGYPSLTAHDLIELRAQNVSPSLIKSLSDAGYTNLSVRDLVRLAASGVNADFIREMQQYKEKK
jgi:beta-lactamase regulating signal transducer with metallopeptidase domain